VSFEVACPLADLANGQAHRVVVGGTAMAVVRLDDDVYALEDRCSHADVALSEGEVEGCTLECWLHGSAFDLRTGRPLTPPASQPVATFATRVVGTGDTAVLEIDSRSVPRDSAAREEDAR
jgi:3-phenylpropionate/trans-cinnamate dioxygenase ferredoxin subunit